MWVSDRLEEVVPNSSPNTDTKTIAIHNFFFSFNHSCMHPWSNPSLSKHSHLYTSLVIPNYYCKNYRVRLDLGSFENFPYSSIFAHVKIQCGLIVRGECGRMHVSFCILNMNKCQLAWWLKTAIFCDNWYATQRTQLLVQGKNSLRVLLLHVAARNKFPLHWYFAREKIPSHTKITAKIKTYM